MTRRMEDDVKALLLTAREQEAAKRSVVHPVFWHAKDDAVCRAQVAKVLAVLLAVSDDKRSPYYQTTNHVEVFLYRIGKDIEAELAKEKE